MPENRKLDENSFYRDDIIRIIIIIIVVLGFMIITWIKSEKNHEKYLLEEQNKYTHVLNNKLYKYDIIKNNVIFYDLENSAVSSYKCNSKCNLMDEKDLIFTINNDSLVFINDNGKYILFDIPNKKISYTFETMPVKLDDTNYSIVENNDKYGLIDDHGNTKLNTIYDFIKYTTGYFVVTDSNGIYILDKDFNELNNEKIVFDNYNDIEVSFNNSVITIADNNAINDNKEYKFDVVKKELIDD